MAKDVPFNNNLKKHIHCYKSLRTLAFFIARQDLINLIFLTEENNL